MRYNSGCLDLFMSKANKHELLTPEQEIMLGKKVQAMVRLKKEGKPRNEFTFKEKREWAEGMRARDKMIEANLRLVVHIATKVFRAVSVRSGTSGMERMDLIQEGNIGLATAVEKYEPEKGYRFSTYAYWWIKQSICRGVQNQERTIRIPDHAHETIRKAMKEEARIMKETGIKPKLSEVAARIKVDREKLEQYLISNRRTKSIEAPTTRSSEDSSAFAEILADPKSLDQDDQSWSPVDLEWALDVLSEKERDIVRLRYGIGTGKSMTLVEISKKYGVSTERVRQICQQAINRMRLKTSFKNSPKRESILGRKYLAAA